MSGHTTKGSDNLFIVLNAINLLAACLAAIGTIPRNRVPATRAHVILWAFFWTLFVSAEYWILGEYSFLSRTSDMEELIVAMTATTIEGQYFHGFGGGNDVAAMAINTGAYFKLETILLQLPIWLANLLHKGGISAIGFIGTYLLTRRGFDTDRQTAFALGALFTLSSGWVTHMTWVHGLGFALPPLAAYLCVIRYGRRFYWTGVILLALVNAISSSITHSVPMLMGTVLFVALFVGINATRRVLMPLLIIASMSLLNWHESLYAKMLIAPWSFRGSDVKIASTDLFQTIVVNLPFSLSPKFLFFALAICSVLWLFASKNPLTKSAIFILVLSCIFGSIIQVLPWARVGLKTLEGVQFVIINNAFVPLVLVILGFALAPRNLSARLARVRAVLPAALFAIAIGLAMWFKAYHGAWILHEGGLSVITKRMERGDFPPPPTPGVVRSVTINETIPLNLPLLAGYETLTAGGLHVNLTSLSNFWRYALVRDGIDVSSGLLSLGNEDLWPCCAPIYFDSMVNIDALRLANVGIIFSAIPLQGKGFRKRAGPDIVPALARRNLPFKQRIQALFEGIIDPPPIYRYDVLDPLPRAYGARGITVVPDKIDRPTFYRQLIEQAVKRHGLIREGDLVDNLNMAGFVDVTELQVLPDGFVLQLSSPDGGVVIVNTPYLPFWNIKNIPIFPINGFQIGVAVPAGTERLTLSYKRPMLREILIKRFAAQ